MWWSFSGAKDVIAKANPVIDELQARGDIGLPGAAVFFSSGSESALGSLSEIVATFKGIGLAAPAVG